MRTPVAVLARFGVLGLLLAVALPAAPRAALGATGPQFGSIGAYGEAFRGGGFDATYYDNGAYTGHGGTPVNLSFVDPVGFTVDPQDPAGPAIYVLDRTSDLPALTQKVDGHGQPITTWRLQKMDVVGGQLHELGVDEFSLPGDESNPNATHDEMLGLAVDPSQHRVYALQISCCSNNLEYVNEILAWSTVPSGGDLQPAAGLAADGVSAGTDGFPTPAVLSTSAQMSADNGILNPQGLSLDRWTDHQGTHDALAVQSADDTVSGVTFGGSGQAGLAQVLTAATGSGSIAYQWSATALDALPNAAAGGESALSPAGISTDPVTGSLTYLLNENVGFDQSSVFDVVAVPADVQHATPTILSSANLANLNDYDRTAVAPVDLSPEFGNPDGMTPNADNFASAEMVQLTNGLDAGIFAPDYPPEPNGDPTVDGENVAGAGGRWTDFDPGIRLLAPEAAANRQTGNPAAAPTEPGLLSNPGYPVWSIFDTLGNPVGQFPSFSSPNIPDGTYAVRTPCNLTDPATATTLIGEQSTNWASGPMPSLAAGSNGALWVLTKGNDSSPAEVSFAGTGSPYGDQTGARQLIEFAPGAGRPCPVPSGTFQMSLPGSHPVSAGQGLHVAANTTVTFDASSILYPVNLTSLDPPPGAVSAYQWTVSDAGGARVYLQPQIPGSAQGYAPGATDSFQFRNPGTYIVTVQEYGDFGEYDASGTVVVTPSSQPTVAFSAAANAVAGQSTQFSAAGAAPATGQTITHFLWSWGDGTFDDTAGSADQHSYATAGTYTVTLTAVEQNNVTNSVTEQVTVAPAPPPPPSPPTAAFTYAPQSPQTGRTVTFDASRSAAASGLSVVDYRWSWGDGATTDIAVPTTTHTYTVAGGHAVQLTVTDSSGHTSAVATEMVALTAPAAIVAAPRVTVRIDTARAAAGLVTVVVSCPATQTSCAGTVRIRSAAAIAAPAQRPAKTRKRSGTSAKRAVVVMGRASFLIAGGRSQTVRVRLTATGRAVLRTLRRLRVVVAIRATNPQGKVAELKRDVTLRAAARAKTRTRHAGTRRQGA